MRVTRDVPGTPRKREVGVAPPRAPLRGVAWRRRRDLEGRDPLFLYFAKCGEASASRRRVSPSSAQGGEGRRRRGEGLGVPGWGGLGRAHWGAPLEVSYP